MAYAAFLQDIAQEIRPVYLLTGPEEYVKDKMLEKLKSAVLTEETACFNLQYLDGEKCGANDIIEACETLPMMADKRLVVVRGGSLFGGGKSGGWDDNREEDSRGSSRDSERLCEYIPQIPSSACLVFFHRGEADKRLKLCKTIEKYGCVAIFDALPPADLCRYVLREFENVGVTITRDLAYRLIFQTGKWMTPLVHEVQKLCSYCKTKGKVEDRDIEAVVTENLEFTIFHMIDALMAGQNSRAMDMFEGLVQKGENGFLIINMLARQFRLMLRFLLMREENLSIEDIKNALGVHPFVMSKLPQQTRHIKKEKLAAFLKLCEQVDTQLKNGTIRNDIAAAEYILFQFCAK